ncbi:MAG: c-type cytochrome [Candidatus Xenobia bacterium]
MRKLILYTVLLIVLAGSPTPAARHVIPWDSASIAAGRVLYLEKCATCHGQNGDGKGPAAETMDPKPRDYRRDAFLYGSSDDDLFTTVWYGPSNRLSTMPPFQWAALRAPGAADSGLREAPVHGEESARKEDAIALAKRSAAPGACLR